MPRFCQESFSKLSTCHIDLQVIFFEVIKSFDCRIICPEVSEGQRNQGDQLAYSVYVSPFPFPGLMDPTNFVYFGGYVMGMAQKLLDEGKVAHKLRYGGDIYKCKYVTEKEFKDYVHFELLL